MKIAKKEETIGKFFSLNLVMSDFLFSVCACACVQQNTQTKYKQHYQI